MSTGTSTGGSAGNLSLHVGASDAGSGGSVQIAAGDTSSAGGKGGDDPDEDLKELPLARWAAAKGARSLARFLGHPLVSSLAMLVALLAALLYSRH